MSDSTRVDVSIDGMTCASCAARVEKSLNRLDGVSATVNVATEIATVAYDPATVAPSDLVEAVESVGYHARMPRGGDHGHGHEHDHMDEMPAGDRLGLRFAVAATLSVPVVVLSMVSALHFAGWEWVALALTLPVVLWAGWPFHRATILNARHGAATMDTLVSIGTLAALSWSIAAIVVPSGPEDLYLEVAAVVTTFLIGGRLLEDRAKRQAGAALRTLLQLGARDVALVSEGGREERVPIEMLRPGALFVVRPGERIATDGVVVEGRSAIDASLLTGESMPVEVGEGDPVTGATINVGGRLVVRATRVGADTALAQMARMVSAAQSGKAPIQRLADRVSAVFVPVVLVLATATLVGWLLAGADAATAFSAAVAVLIIACPCALGLATPTALLAGTGRGAQLGILITGPEVLESTRRVDTVVLDKTGTVTTGEMALRAVFVAEPEDEQQALAKAGAVEDASEHPIARAIADAARARLGALAPVAGFASSGGLGVEGRVDEQLVVVGRPSFLADRGMDLPPALEAPRREAEMQGATAVAVAWGGRARAVLVVSDIPKPTSADAVRELRGMGLRPILLTGDNAEAARAVATAVGIDEVIAEVLPADKSRVVEDLQATGSVVAMVGDGVNDAPALVRADLGIAIGSGTDVAMQASDLTLVSGDLRGVSDAIRLSRRTLGIIRGNLFWAFAYNVAALPLAAAGLLDPMIAGAAMALSSLFVVTNSLRLRTFRPSRG